LKPRRTTSRRDYQALAEIRYRIRLFLAFSEARSRAAGIEPGQHQLLLAIRGLPDDQRTTIGAVAERLGVQHHSAVELAARAERAGLVARRAGTDDRREVILAVTARGERVLDALSREHRAELATSAPALLRALRAVIAGQRKAKR
jgi:DNA-binding MarR family transcriptional regulator